MLTLPTRAKFVETQLGASIYGSKMIFEMHEAMLRATNAGRSSVLYHFDKSYLNDPKAKLLNKLFIEYLKSKKYKIDKETDQNFLIHIK
tara:strand:+ start:4335 stop:4601 length:267 start_codon:yes stop_codon:yes gene_type:complete